MTYSPMLTKSLSRSNTLMLTSTSNPMSESPSQLGTSIVVNFSPILLSTTGPPSQHLNSVFSTHVQTVSQSQYTAMQAMKSSFALLSLSSSLPSSTPSGGSGSLSLIVIVYILEQLD